MSSSSKLCHIKGDNEGGGVCFVALHFGVTVLREV